jgi:hypothetical protein
VLLDTLFGQVSEPGRRAGSDHTCTFNRPYRTMYSSEIFFGPIIPHLFYHPNRFRLGNLDTILLIFVVMMAIGATAISLTVARKIPQMVDAGLNSAFERIEPRYAGKQHYFIYGTIGRRSFLLIILLCVAMGDFFIIGSTFTVDASTLTGFFFLIAGFGLFFTLGFHLMLAYIAIRIDNILLAVTKEGFDYWVYSPEVTLDVSIRWLDIRRVRINVGRGLGGELKLITPAGSIEVETTWVNIPKLYEDTLRYAAAAEIPKYAREIMEHWSKKTI